MILTIATRLSCRMYGATDALLQIEAAPTSQQSILSANIASTPTPHFLRVGAQDGIGERIWVHHDGEFSVSYDARIEVLRNDFDLASLAGLPPHRLPGEAVPYLLDSLYCPASRLQPFVQEEFGALAGGAKVEAMRAWIAGHFRYVPGSSNSATTALDSFVERRGVCRDYAHTLIALARAAAIPARFASGYGPGVSPQDFHAVAEVFLADPAGQGGSWRIVDATGMITPDAFAVIGVGRDAADASFVTSYGTMDLVSKDITVRSE
ncbi:transglutaminase family protein [Novosphingobium sp. EMRT-2]|uniref:transglutaminase-like domain-containing protein n=1 Tax=Novosphingobium sp. EMRT-2 TaxID=2571749 RepID=UPI0010BE06E2|nr:transglutaminase family protein [Novosphingobium sp. EMRT-2]QCI93156.1 transglutaminase family protein [Novosphingobium sp. EMRT-2]